MIQLRFRGHFLLPKLCAQYEQLDHHLLSELLLMLGVGFHARYREMYRREIFSQLLFWFPVTRQANVNARNVIPRITNAGDRKIFLYLTGKCIKSTGIRRCNFALNAFNREMPILVETQLLTRQSAGQAPCRCCLVQCEPVRMFLDESVDHEAHDICRHFGRIPEQNVVM